MKKVLAAFVVAIFAVIGCFFALSCTGEAHVVLEAERAVVCGTPYSDAATFTTTAKSMSENKTSGNRYVSGIAVPGNSVTWVFSAKNSGSAELCLYVSNVFGSDAFYLDSSDYSLKLNGAVVSLPSYALYKGTEYEDNWQKISYSRQNFKAGFNFIELTAVSGKRQFNIDCLEIVGGDIGARVHEHDFGLITTSASCDSGGSVYRECDDCGLNYLFESTNPLGHDFGDWHYDSELNKMTRVCNRDGFSQVADVPSKYFGEVYESADFQTRYYKHTFEAEWAEVDASNGLNNGTDYIERCMDSSGGKSVGNISMLGNSISFPITATANCTVDLVLRAANTLYTDSGIGVLDPLSNYLDIKLFYNGAAENIDVSFVAFPGLSYYDYFNWRYIVMKNVSLRSGTTQLKITPKAFSGTKVSMPNLDALYIYADGEGIISFRKAYDYSDVVIAENYDSAYDNEYEFVKSAQTYMFSCDAENTADIAIELNCDEDGALSRLINLSLGYGSVNLEGLNVKKGSNTVVIKGVNIPAGGLSIAYVDTGAQIMQIRAFAIHPMGERLKAEIDVSYDYFTNADVPGAKVPVYTAEAENALLSGSSSDGESIIQNEASASGGKCVEHCGSEGNRISFVFTLDSDLTADIAIRLACTNYVPGQGNATMENLEEFCVLTVDGISVDLNNVKLISTDPNNWHQWGVLVVKGVDLKAGEHTVNLIAKSNMPNTDALYIYESSKEDL